MIKHKGLKKFQKSEKNSEVGGGWFKPQLGLKKFFGNVVFLCVFCVVFMFSNVSKKKLDRGWVGGV